MKKSKNVSDIIKAYGLKEESYVRYIVRCVIKKHNISTDHYGPNVWGEGRGRKYPNDRVFCKNSKALNSAVIKALLFSGIKEYKCDICGVRKWNEKYIRLQLHHINKTRNDNRIENLEILCPNCHSQKHSGKNIKEGVQRNVINFDRILKEVLTKEVLENEYINKGLRAKNISELYKIPITYINAARRIYKIPVKRKTGYNLSRRKFNVSPEDLSKLVNSNPTVSVAKIFGVSDKAIEKRCKILGIKKPSRGYWSRVRSGVIQI